MTPFCLDNCLDPSRHAFYKSLACFWWNFVPLFCSLVPQFMYFLWWTWIPVQSLLQLYSKVFNSIQVRGLCRPDQDLNVIVLKLLCCLVGGMFRVIILLKDPLLFYYLQLFKTFNHSTIQNSVLSAFMIPWPSVSIPTPFHPMHSHTIRLFPPLCLTVVLVSSDYKTLFQSSTVQFSWYLANLRHSNWWAFLSRRCFCLTTEWKSLCLSAFLTIWDVTGLERMLLI